MRRPLLAIATAFTLAAAIPCIAHSNDENGLPAGQPLIFGKVSRITSHSVIVLTRDGESIPIEFDSRTVMSTNMPTGARVRVEFRLLDSGRYLAQRITPLERGSNEWAALSLRQSARSRSRVEGTTPAGYSNGGTDAQGASDETASNSNATEAGTDASVASSEGGKRTSTSSALPMILVIGVLMLVGTLFLRWVRRRAS